MREMWGKNGGKEFEGNSELWDTIWVVGGR